MEARAVKVLAKVLVPITKSSRNKIVNPPFGGGNFSQGEVFISINRQLKRLARVFGWG